MTGDIKKSFLTLNESIRSYADSEGWDRGSGPPQKNHKAIGFLSNTGPDPLKIHKAPKPAFNVWSSSAGLENVSLVGR